MALNAGDLIGPYEILSLVGAGGMGEVYKARDTRLDRLVALKMLSSSQVADSDRKQRFLTEARVASKLNHPNIVTIYDILAENGESFIAMEFVEGVTLEEMRSGAGLPLKDAMKHAVEIAEALAAAHSAGIIHRDLKPANIIVTSDGRAKLLDFGLAKLAEPRLPALEAETATSTVVTAAIMGTAPYMSPEQAGGREIDARSDIFSYGSVLYEMLSGRRAFSGDSWISTVAAILHEEPRPLQEVRVEVPSEVVQFVARCLRKSPADRFQNMSDARRALNEAISLSGAAFTKGETQSIAILPFVNLTTDKENEYFGDGLAEEILNALAKVPNLKVIARTSAFAFRGQERDLRAIGERLRVRTILEGSVRRSGNRVRIATQLINVADESQLWSERFDREMTDIFAIQDEISQAIANALKVNLGIPQRHAGNIEAFQSYLQGLYWYQRYTAESLSKAKDSFEQALAYDPGYAPAHAGLAVFYYGLGALSVRRMTDMAPLAQSAAEKALAMDPTLREAHSVLGLLAGTAQYDWKLAERHFQTAMAADPVPPLVRVRYALYFLTPQRRFEEAVEQYKHALETDPLSMMVHFGLSFAFYCQRQFDAAIKHAEKAVNLYPDYWLVHFAMGLALLQKGDLEKSITSLETTVKLSPAFTLGAGFLAAASVQAGDRGKSDKLMEQITERSAKSYASPSCFAIYYAALGQADPTFKFLEAALTERDPYLTRVDAEPCFEPFHSDPRYRDLLARMNLSRTAVL